MVTRFRLLRFRTKAALAISILFVVVIVVNFKKSVTIFFPNYFVVIAKGGLGFAFNSPYQEYEIELDAPWPGWEPRIMTYPNYYFIFIPVWCIAPFVFIPTVLLWRKDRHIPEGHCQNCGYNLTGNVSGKCSECGQSIQSNSGPAGGEVS